MTRAPVSDIKGGDAEENAVIVKAVLKGEKGPKRDMVLLNAGAAFYAAAKSSDIQGGIALAAKSIDDGAAYKKLDLLIEKTNQAPA